MPNLEAFKSQIRGGVRPNQFDVEIDSSPMGGAFSQIPYMCHSTTLPGSSVGQAQVFFRGRMIPLGGERTFNPWTCTVYADQTHALRTRFEQWSDLFNNYANNSGLTDPFGYKGSAIVTQLDRNELLIKKYHVLGIFPIDISEIQVAWQQNDVVEEFSVTFAVERVDPFL